MRARIKKFPYEPYLRNGRSNLLRLGGRLSEALSSYDQATNDFQFDFVSRISRAYLLKELGRYDLAIEAFERVEKLRPEFAPAKFHKASVLAILGQYEEALALLPEEAPRTRSEWIAEHVKGMIYLRLGKLEKALDVFARGVLHNQFAKERRYFENAHAIAQIRQKDFQRALSHARSGEGIAANVLKFHSYAALGREVEARREFQNLDRDPRPAVAELSKEIAVKFGIVSGRSCQSDEWIEAKHTEVVLALAA